MEEELDDLGCTDQVNSWYVYHVGVYGGNAKEKWKRLLGVGDSMA